MRPTRTFLSTLGAIAITVASWFTEWRWCAFPGLTALSLLHSFSRTQFQRELVVVTVIVINIAVWALILWSIQRAVARLSDSRRGAALRDADVEGRAIRQDRGRS